MKHRTISVAVFLLAAAWGGVASAQGHALFWKAKDLVPASQPSATAQHVLSVLLAGPTATERGRGVSSAIDPRTILLGLSTEGNRVVADVSRDVLRSPDQEAVLEQMVKSLASLGYDHISIRTPDAENPERFVALGDRPDTDPVPMPAPPAVPLTSAVNGVLSGLTIVVSPGHGYYWHSSLGWTTQRGNIGGLTEDIHNNEIAMEWVIPHLENAGARVISCRDRTRNLEERIVNNDGGTPGYTESGAWSTGGSSGFGGGTYRFATGASTESARATFTMTVSRAGYFPVWTAFKAGSNRIPDARFLIEHAAGTTEVRVDQRTNDLRLYYLGTFYFRAGTARVHVTNETIQPGRVVIADWVRIGGGLGSIVRGGTSNRPRWQEAARYWTQFAGAPSGVWNSVSGGQDNNDDVTARPRYAEWRTAHAFVSMHTNAGGGTGTSSFIHDTAPSAGSANLQNAIHAQLIGDIRSQWDSSWTDRGKKTANFGEVRLLSTMPGVLLELAFHDDPNKKDHAYLHHPGFRRVCGRAIARGVIRYFNQTAPFPPEPPTQLRVEQDGLSRFRVSWAPVAGATGYLVESSTDGYAFDGTGASVTGTSWSSAMLPHDTTRGFRVRAVNASGQSMPSEVLVGRTGPTLGKDILLVQGFDRFGRNVKEPENRRNYLGRFLDAIDRIGDYSVAVDSVSNEAIGAVSLTPYRAVIWALGEESTVDETFSPSEQAVLRSYLQNGGRVFVNGAEIGWDLDSQGSSADRTFYRSWLAALYVNDDANVYRAGAAAGSIFAGLPDLTFDDGTNGTYDVNFPDSLAPNGTGAKSSLLYRNTSFVAATEQVNGQTRVLNWGFPFETITDANVAGQYMDRAVAFLLAPHGLEAPRTATPGQMVPLTFVDASQANRPYVLAASFGKAPGIPVGARFTIPLNADPLFFTSVGSNSGIFLGFAGILDGNGAGSAQVLLPNLPIQGLQFYVSGIVLNGSNVSAVFPWRRVTVQ